MSTIIPDRLRSFLFWLLVLVVSTPGRAQEVPQVLTLSHPSQSFDQHCWSIVEGCDGLIYSATASGVNVYNGFEWNTAPLPYNRIARCLFLGKNCRVYVGGFETFGYIDWSRDGEPIYVPVGDSLLRGTHQEIWNIMGESQGMVIQSFSMVLEYDYSRLRELAVPRNIRLGQLLYGTYYFPDINGGLLTIERDSLVEIKPPPADRALRISALAATPARDQLLLASERSGFFTIRIPVAAQELVSVRDTDLDFIGKQQINDVQQLKSGAYAIGTVRGGVYITNDIYEVEFHISKQNGMCSNTVISMHEDDFGNLWVGTDCGVNVIRLGSDMRCYYDNAGLLGTLYATETFGEELFMSTSHGVFKRKGAAGFELLSNTEGQSWALLVFDDVLLCGHNNGTYAYNGESAQLISDVTGGWWMTRINDSTVLQSTYTGLITLIRTDESWRWKRVEDGNILIRKFVLAGNRLLGYHSRYGLCHLELEENLNAVVSETYMNTLGNDPIDPAVGIFDRGTDFVIKWRDSLYEASTEGLKLTKASAITDPGVQANIRQYDFLMSSGELFALANLDHNSLASQEQHIISRPYGYSMQATTAAPADLAVSIDHVVIAGDKRNKSALEDLRPGQKNIIIQLCKTKDLSQTNALTYLLEPSDDTWLPIPASGAMSFQNLASETYTLHIRDGFNNRKELVTFSVPAPWHLSWPGGVLYMTLVLGTFLVWNRRVRKNTAERARLKHEDEVRRLEAERIRQNNEQLQREVQLKSKLLANRAMALAQKNKLLLQMKDLAKTRHESETKNSELRSRIIRMVDQQTNHEDEWKVFENNFDEVHAQFTERLLEAHPNLTAGDKRLASFIRMDLTSKEIAPLLRISVRSVENKRHRLRKKMRLESGQRLNEYLMRF